MEKLDIRWNDGTRPLIPREVITAITKRNTRCGIRCDEEFWEMLLKPHTKHLEARGTLEVRGTL